jgi:hypothetical protein
MDLFLLSGGVCIYLDQQLFCMRSCFCFFAGINSLMQVTRLSPVTKYHPGCFTGIWNAFVHMKPLLQPAGFPFLHYAGCLYLSLRPFYLPNINTSWHLFFLLISSILPHAKPKLLSCLLGKH